MSVFFLSVHMGAVKSKYCDYAIKTLGNKMFDKGQNYHPRSMSFHFTSVFLCALQVQFSLNVPQKSPDITEF